MIWECRCVAYKAGERPDLEADIVPDLTELTIEADTYQGAGQGSVPKGVPSSLICPLTQVALPGCPGCPATIHNCPTVPGDHASWPAILLMLCRAGSCQCRVLQLS